MTSKESSQISYLNRLDLDTIEKDWFPPDHFPDLRNADYIAIDLETSDPNIMTLVLAGQGAMALL